MLVKRIVVGVDGSEGAARALEWAIGLARGEGAEIIAVYALGPVEDLVRGTTAAVWAGLGLPHESTWRNELRRELEQDWCAPLRAAGLPFRAHLEEASAPAGLMAVADREDADLIVVGAHGHGGFEDRVLGSVSYKLSHRARHPVVIVPLGRGVTLDPPRASRRSGSGFLWQNSKVVCHDARATPTRLLPPLRRHRCATT